MFVFIRDLFVYHEIENNNKNIKKGEEKSANEGTRTIKVKTLKFVLVQNNKEEI